MQDFKNLDTYQKAYQLSRDIYEEIKDRKDYRFKDQLFGAITSIPAHLAELSAYDSGPERIVRLRRSIGEANEAEFWLTFAKDSGMLDETKCSLYLTKLTEVRKMLQGLMNRVKQTQSRTKNT